MTHDLTHGVAESDLQYAAAQLALSQKGRHAMWHLLSWLDEDGLSLDAVNQGAVLTLLVGAWGGFPGTARDLMRAAVIEPELDTDGRHPRR